MQAKRESLAAAGVSSAHVRFFSWDFVERRTEDLPAALRAAGLSAAAPSVVRKDLRNAASEAPDSVQPHDKSTARNNWTPLIWPYGLRMHDLVIVMSICLSRWLI